MISMRVYNSGDDVMIGACDEHLLGKKFTRGKLQIDVSTGFYEGQRVSSDVLKKHLEDATIANLVGTQAVEVAVTLGLVDPDCVLRIDGVPHAQIVRMM